MKEKLVTVAHFTDDREADLARQPLPDESTAALIMGRSVGSVEARKAGQGPEDKHQFEEERE